MTFTTCADLLRPATGQKALAYDGVLVIGGSLFIALCAQFTIHVGPVPITGQTLGVLLTGMLLGSRRGSLSVLAYLAEGIAGLPVFAPGGPPGLARLLGPTGGYLLGFVAAAYVTGLLAERGWDRKSVTTLVAMLIGNAVIYAFGLPWLALFVGIENALPLGFYPFIIGDLAKAFLAAALLPIGWRLLTKTK
ncbi:MAG: biotin transporter BioY [Anaerolineae bacterium]|jgi:biotin transport system substrate-specific component|nr:biotin transporter BioY [Anaerolineae bacterium]